MRMQHLLPALLLGLGVLGLLGLPVQGDENSDASKIAKLIEELGSDTFAVRQKAAEALDAIGEPALEALRKAASSKDAETRKRATDLVSKIEKRAESSRVLKPTMIHLVYKDKPLTEAVEDFKKKSGYLIVLHDPDGKLKDKKITLDTGKVTFWKALELFCVKAGVKEGDPNADRFNRPINPPIPLPPVKPLPAPGGKALPAPGGARPAGGAALAQAPGAPAILPAQPALPPVGGPAGGPGMPPGFRPWVQVQPGQITLLPGKADATPADTSSSVRVRAGDKKTFRIAEKEIVLTLAVTPEPKVRLQNLMGITIDKAIDDNNQKLKTIEGPANPLPGGLRGGRIGVGGGIAVRPGVMIMPAFNGLGRTTWVRLEQGEKAAKSLKELSGTMSAQLLGEAEKMIAADKVMKAAGKSFKGKQGGEMKILTASKGADGTIEITFEFELPANVIPETRINLPAANVMPVPPIRPLPPVPAKPPVPPAGAPAGGAPGAVPGAAGGGVAGVGVAQPGIAIGRPVIMNFAYNGLTLQDAKGNILPATVRPNFKKAGRGGVVIIGGPGGGGKMEYLATYRPAGKDAAEPASLVFTARRQITVNIPFKLENIELK
jgi:hypothetical protein